MTLSLDYIPAELLEFQQMQSPVDWHSVRGVPLYSEKVFPNRKVGHVMANPNGLWRASLDGIICGRAETQQDAQFIVEATYDTKYGG